MASARVLLVHDHPGVLDSFRAAAGSDLVLATAAETQGGLLLLEGERFDVVVTDLEAPADGALELLHRARALPSAPEVILLAGRRGIDEARRALDAGAFAFLVKPFRAPDVARVLARAVEHHRLLAEVARLRRELDGRFTLEELVGTSPKMRAAAALIAQAAESGGDVSIRGGPGTGKELAARVIHYRSPRRAAPFVPVHCAGLPPGVAEERLFGAAGAGEAGLFSQADGGTLFLDEVAALPAPAQARLGRLLFARRVPRAGKCPGAGLRVIAASRVDLAEEARAGRLRRELALTLRTAVIVLPPLRERPEDIPLLANHFLQRAVHRAGGPVTGFDAAALCALAAWPWPGNCRELELAVERAVAACDGPLVRLQDLPPEILEDRRGPPEVLASLPYREAMDQVAERASRDYLAALLAECGGNVSAAARRAHVQRETLHRLLARCGLRSADFRSHG